MLLARSRKGGSHEAGERLSHSQHASRFLVGQYAVRRRWPLPEIVSRYARSLLSSRTVGRALGIASEAMGIFHGIEPVCTWRGYRMASSLCVLESASDAEVFCNSKLCGVLFRGVNLKRWRRLKIAGLCLLATNSINADRTPTCGRPSIIRSIFQSGVAVTLLQETCRSCQRESSWAGFMLPL